MVSTALVSRHFRIDLNISHFISFSFITSYLYVSWFFIGPISLYCISCFSVSFLLSSLLTCFVNLFASRLPLLARFLFGPLCLVSLLLLFCLSYQKVKHVTDCSKVFEELVMATSSVCLFQEL